MTLGVSYALAPAVSFLLGQMYFIAFTDTAFFYTLEVCGDSASGRSMGAIFPPAFAHFVVLGHMLVILAIFQTLHQQKGSNLLTEGSGDG